MEITQQEKQFKLKSCSILFTKNDFQLNVESYPGSHWFCFTSLCDWSRDLAPLSQPIKSKTKANLDSVAHVFPRFRQLDCFYLELSLVLKIFSSPLIGRCYYFSLGFTTLNRKARLSREANAKVYPVKHTFRLTISILQRTSACSLT